MARGRIGTAGLAAALAVATALVGAGRADAQGRIGAVGAVNNDMTGTPPAADARPLFLGDGVVANELIQTSPRGNGHLLFVDQTTLAIAPSSDIVLDRYVYDPDRATGDVAVSLTKGALRFIGGKITEGRAATIRTPTATIGIRGSGAIIEVAEACSAGPGASGCETKVTVLSAEEVTVTRYGDSDGDGIDDGPGGEGEAADGAPVGEGQFGAPNPALASLSASVPGGQLRATGEGAVQYLGKIDDAESSRLIAAFEGSRDGGAPAIATAPAATVQQAGQTVAEVNSAGGGGAGAEPQQAGGAADVASAETAERAPADETAITTVSLEDNSLAEELQNAPEDILLGDIPSPADLARLSGFATYTGVAEGVLADTSITGGDPSPNPFTGSFTMTYDFDFDDAAIDFDVLGGRFSTSLAAEGTNSPAFSGTAPIAGGPDTVSASGTFLFEGNDPAGRVSGDFEIDVGTQDLLATGTFAGPRDD